MSVEIIENNKVFRKDQLLARYYMFSASSAKPITDRTIQKWRSEKGFPDPVCSRPRVVWLRSEVLAWEKQQGWDKFLEGHGNDENKEAATS
ncbi:helix-turn-helix transcriptional regulator [Vibrio harveyi]|uniref:helix-turn-helix transcriptional regulator n=1 Tax=Vibrio harveyi TaxID=669 RepID=UPI0025B06C55|nr:hypothetical protein [Vibrio harveyi]WJT09234.1 hypothetical protein PH545_24725 [Vibrio harveyi]